MTKTTMSNQENIIRQTATVRMLEMMHKANRASLEELERARRRLAELQQLETIPNKIPGSAPISGPVAEETIVAGPKVDEQQFLSLQADLSKEADQLNRKMADLSNKLHLVPAGTACPELTGPILQLKSEIEAIWDKKKYLERNRCLPEEKAADTSQTPVDSQEKLALAQTKRRLIDQRSKLKKKLENPKAKAAKRQEWEIELVKASLQINQIDDQLRLIS